VLVLQTLVCHVAFSVIAVKLYLEPVLEALRMGQAVEDSRKFASGKVAPLAQKNPSRLQFWRKHAVKDKYGGEETKDDPEDDDDIDVLKATRGGEDATSGPKDGTDKGDVEAAGSQSGITRHIRSLQRMGMRACLSDTRSSRTRGDGRCGEWASYLPAQHCAW
jgi:hypothetical protein